MTIYFTVDEAGHLDGWQSNPSDVEGEISLDVSEDHEVLMNPHVFKYENDKLVKDTEYQQKLKKEAEKEANKPTDENVNALAILELAEQIELMKGEK